MEDVNIYSKMTDDELIAERQRLKNEITALNGKQMALKILNNSLDQSIWGMCL